MAAAGKRQTSKDKADGLNPQATALSMPSTFSANDWHDASRDWNTPIGCSRSSAQNVDVSMLSRITLSAE